MKLLARSFLISSLVLAAAAAPNLAAAHEHGSGEATEHGQGMKSRGIVRLVGEALAQVDLKPEQRAAVDALGHVVMSGSQAKEAKRALVGALADQLASGHVDRDALRPQLVAFVRSAGCEGAVRGRVLDELHRILTAEQRQKFASVLEQRLAALAEGHKGDKWIDRLARELDLSDQQKEQIRTAAKDWEPLMARHHEALQKILDAFKGETFELRQVIPDYDPAAHALAVAKAMVDATEKLSQILTPEQRTRAADKVRSHMAHEHEESGKSGSKEDVGESQEKLVWGVPYGYGFGYPGYPGAVAPYGYGYGYGWPSTYGFGWPGYGVSTFFW